MFKLLLKAFARDTRFTWLFIFNVALGLSGFIALDSFKNAIESTLQTHSRAVLGADFGFTARRPIRNEETQRLAEAVTESYESARVLEFFSMAVSPDGISRLVQIKAIEPNFPFYGRIELESDKQNRFNLHVDPVIWVYPELLSQLHVQVGQTLKIGPTEFTIAAVVLDDAAQGISTSMAPRVYMSLSQSKKTQLIRAGSLAWHSVMYKIPKYSTNRLNQLSETLFEQIDDPDLQIYTHENASEQMGRLLSYLNDFLGLAALSALFLSAVGGGFLFHAYRRSQVQSIALLQSLGLVPLRAMLVYITQVAVLGLISAGVAMLISLLLLPIFLWLGQQLFPLDITLGLDLQTVVIAVFLGVIGSVFFCFPLFFQLRCIKPAVLLQSSPSIRFPWDKFSLLSCVPGLLSFWLLAVYQSNSWIVGTIFVGLFLATAFLLSLFAWLVCVCLDKQRLRAKVWRWALRDLARFKLSSTTALVALGLGMVLLNIMPQLQATLYNELQNSEGSSIPSFFLFDIQEEQVEMLKQLAENENFSISALSPMIRARFSAVNGQLYDKGQGEFNAHSREAQQEARFRNRGVNLSYRQNLTEAETLVKGKLFLADSERAAQSLPQISLEKRFADRLGLKIGDQLSFDIQDIIVTGEVVNLRRVRWSSFQPNFFIQFESGVLELAPKTFLASIESMAEEKKAIVQNKIVTQLPNVSIVDVTRLVAKLQNLMNYISWALQVMSALCILVGLMVLYAIVNYQARMRTFDIGLLKALGGSFGDIRKLFIYQYGFLAFIAGCFGIVLSLLLSWVFTYLFFEGVWVMDLKLPVISLLVLMFMALGVTLLATNRFLKTSPTTLLRSI